jgi:hypothetical protein
VCERRHGLRSIGGTSLSNRFKLLLVVLVSVFVCSCSSGSRKPAEPATPQEQSFTSTPPFKTSEPEKYRAERVFTFTSNEGTSTLTKTLIARDGDLRREEIETAGHKIVLLENSQTRTVLMTDAQIYAEVGLGTSIVGVTEDTGSSPERLLHEDSPLTSSYEKLGVEPVDGRTATKYRVVVNNSAGNNVSKLETLIWIDESLGMPIRSESNSEGRQIVMALTNIALTVDESLFRIPEGYKKVAVEEITQRLARH